MIVIVGAGICGLGIGWHLARAGLEVTLFDRGEAGRGASWAAGGMLAPRAEAEPVGRLLGDRMQGVYGLEVPLVVDVGSGQTWREAH